MRFLTATFKSLARRCAWIPLSALLLVAGCETVPETGRSQLMLLGPEAEVELGATAFQELRQELDLIDEGPQVEMVREVGRRISEAAQPELEAQGFGDLDWEFHVADSEELNAFVLPGGKVVFYRGMVDLLENEDEVAAVMGHEIAHVVARHSGERISQNILTQVGLAGAQVALQSQDPSRRDPILAALGVGATVGVILPYSRSHESEADEIGLTLMARAGYDPRAAVAVWERMAEVSDTRAPEFLSTHPNPQRRAESLRELMPRALEIYEGEG